MQTKLDKQEPLELHYDNLVLGGTLEAFYFAHVFNFPIIYSHEDPPFRFENHPEIGDKLEYWGRLNFILNMSGKNPFAGNCSSITFIDRETLRVITKNDKRYNLKYKKLWLFSDYSLFNFVAEIEFKTYDCEIIDQFKILDKWLPQVQHIYRDDRLLKEFHFFKDKPHSKKHKYKHFYVVSRVDQSLLDKTPEYFIKIRAEKLLGCEKIEHVRRFIRYRQGDYTDTETITFCNATFDEMYPFSLTRKKITYQKYLKSKLKL
jgi:hypothetical protein